MPEDPSLVRKERPAKAGKEQTWLFLRTLSATLLIAWLVPAMLAPPDPFTFFLWLVPSWSVGILAAIWLVYWGGFAKLSASDLYRPGFTPARAVVTFVVGTLVLKTAFTVATNVVVGSRPFAVDGALSVLSLVVSYLLVYQGALARTTGGTVDDG